MRRLFEIGGIREQGFLSRVLFCYPESEMGSRVSPDPKKIRQATKVLKEYDACMARWLETPLRLREGTNDELDPPRLRLTRQSREVFEAYVHQVEAEMRGFGTDAPETDLVNKSSSMALRIAATLQLADDCEGETLQSEYMKRGVKIAWYHFQESIRLYTPVHPSPHLVPARLLLKHLKDKGLTSFSCAQLGKTGPHSLRTQSAHGPVIAFLATNGWLKRVEMPAPKTGGRKKTVYHLTSKSLDELNMP